MSQMSKKTKQWLAIGIGLLVIFILATGYRFGYRFSNFTIGKVGHVNVVVQFEGTGIIVDEKQKINTVSTNQTLTLSPGNHEIIVSKDGYFPWVKDFTLPSAGNLTLSPIFVLQNPTGEIITEKDPEYWKIKNEVETAVLPTKEKPLVSADSVTSIWVENNSVMATVNGEIHTVIQPMAAIKNLQFYKNRTDVLIFSAGDSVSIIETDTKGTQNFFPIYKGTNPLFLETSSDFIYVLDGSVLMQVVI